MYASHQADSTSCRTGEGHKDKNDMMIPFNALRTEGKKKLCPPLLFFLSSVPQSEPAFRWWRSFTLIFHKSVTSDEGKRMRVCMYKGAKRPDVPAVSVNRPLRFIPLFDAVQTGAVHSNLVVDTIGLESTS